MKKKRRLTKKEFELTLKYFGILCDEAVRRFEFRCHIDRATYVENYTFYQIKKAQTEYLLNKGEKLK